MYSVLSENFEKKDQFIQQNIIKDLIKKDNDDFTFKYRNCKIRQELSKVSIVLEEEKIMKIIQELNKINISFKKVPLKFQLFKICVILKYGQLMRYYNIDCYKNKDSYEKIWSLYHQADFQELDTQKTEE